MSDTSDLIWVHRVALFASQMTHVPQFCTEKLTLAGSELKPRSLETLQNLFKTYHVDVKVREEHHDTIQVQQQSFSL